MNKCKQVLAIREGGQTKRAHTMQYAGEYNVAIHSYNALSLLLLLYPGEPSVGLIKAVLWHDVPERWTGDVPAPAKWASPELKKILDDLEQTILEKIGIGELYVGLRPEQLNWLNGVDLLELFIWAKEQKANGAYFADYMIDRIIGLISDRDREGKIPKEIINFVANFKWSRSVECHELK